MFIGGSIMLGSQKKRSGYLRRLDSSDATTPFPQNNIKRARVQSPIQNTTTTATQKQWVTEMEYTDKHSNSRKKITLGPLPFMDLISAMNKKFTKLKKDYPESQGVQNLLESFSDINIQPVAAALSNPIYCLPTDSLYKCNDLDACALNNGQHIVAARISDQNEISLFLRMHPLKNNYRLYMETQVLVPEWLENDIREEMTNLLVTGNGELRHYDHRNLTNTDINKVTTAIASGTFRTLYPEVKYVYQLLCRTFQVYFHAPTPKIVDDLNFDTDWLFEGFQHIQTVPPSPSLLTELLVPDHVQDVPLNPMPHMLQNLFATINPLEENIDPEANDFFSLFHSDLFDTPVPIPETSSPPPLIFTQEIKSNNHIIQPKQNYRY